MIEIIDGEKGGTLNSLDELYYMVSELKKTKRHLFSNFFLDEEMKKKILTGKLYYHYTKNICLNIREQDKEFDRLYFYIADFEKYRYCEKGKKTVCDIFYCKNRDVVRDVLLALYRNGFFEYASFSKYVYKGTFDRQNGDDVHLVEGAYQGFYDLLCRCFDKITDYIPEKDYADEYFRNHYCYSYLNKEVIGGVVITVRGSVATEEFIFVSHQERGKGIAHRLRVYWHNHMPENVNKNISWVRDDNIVSWSQLLNFGYNKDGSYKITLTRG